MVAKKLSLSQYRGGATTIGISILPWQGVCELGFQAGLIGISSELGSGVDGPAMAGVCTRRGAGYAAEGCGSGKGRPVNKKLAKVPGAGAGSSG